MSQVYNLQFLTYILAILLIIWSILLQFLWTERRPDLGIVDWLHAPPRKCTSTACANLSLTKFNAPKSFSAYTILHLNKLHFSRAIVTGKEKVM